MLEARPTLQPAASKAALQFSAGVHRPVRARRWRGIAERGWRGRGSGSSLPAWSVSCMSQAVQTPLKPRTVRRGPEQPDRPPGGSVVPRDRRSTTDRATRWASACALAGRARRTWSGATAWCGRKPAAVELIGVGAATPWSVVTPGLEQCPGREQTTCLEQRAGAGAMAWSGAMDSSGATPWLPEVRAGLKQRCPPTCWFDRFLERSIGDVNGISPLFWRWSLLAGSAILMTFLVNHYGAPGASWLVFIGLAIVYWHLHEAAQHRRIRCPTRWCSPR